MDINYIILVESTKINLLNIESGLKTRLKLVHKQHVHDNTNTMQIWSLNATNAQSVIFCILHICVKSSPLLNILHI